MSWVTWPHVAFLSHPSYTWRGVSEHPVRGVQSSWPLMENQYHRVIYSTHRQSGSGLWMLGRSCTSMSPGTEGWRGYKWCIDSNGALLLYQHPISALHYAHYKPNQIKVMCVAITLWIFHQPTACHLTRWPKSGDLHQLKPGKTSGPIKSHEKGQVPSELSANVRIPSNLWDVYVCAHWHACACANILRPIYFSRLKNQDYFGKQIATKW